MKKQSQNKPNFKTEVRKQNTEDSKISAKSTPKLRFSFPTSFFYNCRESSTNQAYFMQNKANFQMLKKNVNVLLKRDYENRWQRPVSKNKPNSNPNKTNLKRAKMDVNIYYTEVYENILCIRQSMKTNPNKPNFKRILLLEKRPRYFVVAFLPCRNILDRSCQYTRIREPRAAHGAPTKLARLALVWHSPDSSRLLIIFALHSTKKHTFRDDASPTVVPLVIGIRVMVFCIEFPRQT